MPPLYKRYVPPKPASGVSPDVAAAVAPISTNGGQEGNKRKRERSSDEVAQRKAKKLDRRTLKSDVATIETPQPGTTLQPSKAADQSSIAALPSDQPDGPHGPNGDFSHIKNAKKRHKLEKEARKARKAAEKIGREDPPKSNHVAAGDAPGQAGGQRTIDPVQELSSGDGSGVLDNSADENGPASQQVQRSEAAPGLKKRRHKLESVLNSGDAVDTQNVPQDDEHLRKHSSVLSKFQKATRARHTTQDIQKDASEEKEEIVLHDLVPLPQPAQRTMPTPLPSYSALPDWLERPVSVPQTAVKLFAEMGLNERLVDHLAKLQFRQALPVQQAVIPLLLSPGSPGARYPRGTESVVPDLAISAPTGSGKTLAYLLPIIEQLKMHCGSGKLAALVVVPTRELVSQVAAIATSLAKGSKVTIGMATGTTKLRDEQERLVLRSFRYDRAAYRQLMTQVHRRSTLAHEHVDDLDLDVDLDSLVNPKDTGPAAKAPPNHVVYFESSIDLLVCTPGRLSEHLKSTPGFSLAHLQWLVLDEADKLLDEQYDGFIDRLQATLSRPRSKDEQDARESYLRHVEQWNERDERRVRKILLSATMTQDVSKLLALQLRRPKLLVVQDDSGQLRPTHTDHIHLLELPHALTEFCMPVGDGSDKPLHLIQLLESKAIPPEFLPVNSKALHVGRSEMDDVGSAEEEDESSSEDSGSGTSDASSSDVLSSDTSSISSGGSSTMSAESEAKNIHPARAALLTGPPAIPTLLPTALIFTSSNEAAMRLSRLMKLLRPRWAPWITTLAKSRQKISFGEKGQPSLTICTDRAARGLDTLADRHITHVFQYDVPRSLESYVHRVGRTARAGRTGEAYTLYTHPEARWFLHQVARNPQVRRNGAVEKMEVPEIDAILRKKFERALDRMSREVSG